MEDVFLGDAGGLAVGFLELPQPPVGDIVDPIAVGGVAVEREKLRLLKCINARQFVCCKG
ncbi:hypothetical protein D3C72_2268090 [compost metagenome]